MRIRQSNESDQNRNCFSQKNSCDKEPKSATLTARSTNRCVKSPSTESTEYKAKVFIRKPRVNQVKSNADKSLLPSIENSRNLEEESKSRVMVNNKKIKFIYPSPSRKGTCALLHIMYFLILMFVLLWLSYILIFEI
jgi:hypothetical protein